MAIKKLKSVPATEILFFRSVICYISNYFLIKINNVSVYTPTKKLHFMVMFRCFFGTLAHFCYYQAISMMNLSDAMAIFLTTPIVTTILASIFLSEGFQKAVLASIIVSFIGILLIVKPPFIFNALGIGNSSSSSELSVVGLIICAVFAIFESATNLVIKALGR